MKTDSESGGPVRLPFARNWLSLTGLIVVMGSIFAFVLLLMFDLFAGQQNPYLGILTFVIAPGFFFLGACLYVVGRVLQRRQEAGAKGIPVRTRLVIDLSQKSHRRTLAGFVVGGLGFLLISAIGSYQTYHVTDSVVFCGQACHAPMEPQFVAYQHSPHARVACTDCHIGPGTGNFLKAKFNGVHQLYATAFDDFEQPIHLSGKIDINQQTCEQCHWPERNAGNLERTYNHYLADEANTPFSVQLLLKVGGAAGGLGHGSGIHWHMNINNRVEYIATDKYRQEIPWVRITDAAGKVTEFRSPDFKDEPSAHTLHTMDCTDCHNRPAHQFKAPADSVDLAIAQGLLSTNLPTIKLAAVQALTAEAATQDEGVENIASLMAKSYPDQPKAVVQQAVDELQRIYRQNFFPEMKVNWSTHPNNIGHKDWPGCFRCHDGKHKTVDGTRSLGGSDCNSCHTILAQGDRTQIRELNPDGHPFLHVDAEYSDFSCTECHTGGIMKE